MTWIQTYSGVQFWPLEPRPEDVRIEDIANGLALTCSFNGQCNGFYSVAQHSVQVADAVQRVSFPKGMARPAALLHDAAKAYLSDIPRPIKPALSEFSSIELSSIEKRLLRVIHTALGVHSWPDLDELIKYWDNAVFAAEKRDLMGPSPAEWDPLPEPTEGRIVPWGPDEAKANWLEAWVSTEPAVS